MNTQERVQANIPHPAEQTRMVDPYTTPPEYMSTQRGVRIYSNIQCNQSACYVLIPKWYPVRDDRTWYLRGKILSTRKSENAIPCAATHPARGNRSDGWRLTIPRMVYEDEGVRVIEWRAPRDGILWGMLRTAPRWGSLPLAVSTQELLIQSKLDPTPDLVEYLRRHAHKETFTVPKLIATARALYELRTTAPRRA